MQWPQPDSRAIRAAKETFLRLHLWLYRTTGRPAPRVTPKATVGEAQVLSGSESFSGHPGLVDRPPGWQAGAGLRRVSGAQRAAWLRASTPDNPARVAIT